MKKFLRTLMLMAAMLLPFASQAQETLTVANGTVTNDYVPIYGYYTDSYLRAQTIYPASYLSDMAGSQITGLTFYAENSSVSWGSASFVVKLTEVSVSSFSSSSYNEATSTTVFSGQLSISGGQMTIDFNTPYEYNGGNLLLEVDNMVEGTYVSCSWYGITATGASLYAYDYTSFSDISYPTSQAFIPKTTFSYIGSDVSCNGVKNLAVVDSLTTPNSLTITWFDTSNSGADYNVYLISGTDTTLLDNVSNTSFTIDTLRANTVYTFGVEVDCGSGDMSSMRSVSGRTACGAEEFPWSESFDATLADDPCWRGAHQLLSAGMAPTLGAPSTSWWNYMTSTSNGLPAGHYRLNIYGESCRDWLVTPPIDLTEESEAALKFDAAFTVYNGTSPANVTDIADDKFIVFVSTNNGATWDTAEVFNLASLAGTSYAMQVVDLSDYVGNVVRIAFYGESTVDGGDNNLHIDNIQVNVPPTCMPVTGFTVVNDMTTAHTATLNWVSDAGSYQVEYKAAADTAWETEATSDTNYTLTGLNPTTTYNVRVKAICDGDDESDYSGTLSFTTTVACPAPSSLRVVLTPGDGTTATILWNDLTGSAWQLCLNGDTSNVIDVTDTTSFTFDTLTPEQTYTVQVRRDCSEDEEGYSLWTPVTTFTPTDAYTITVNDGTTTNYRVPVYGSYADYNTKSQFVIPAAMLTDMQFSAVTKMTFYSQTQNVSWGSASFKVYLTETDATTVSSLSPVDDMEEVYSGSLSISGDQMVVNLTNSYLYTGGNLLVAFEETTTGSYSYSYWYGVSATGASMGGYSGGYSGIEQQNFLPKTTFDYIPGDGLDCYPVGRLAVVDTLTNDSEVTLSWVDTNNSNATYSVYVITATDTTLAGTATDTVFTVDELDANTAYTFGVVADCGGDLALMRTIAGHTTCAPIALPYTETFENGGEACWRIVDNYRYTDYSGNPYVGIYNYGSGAPSPSKVYRFYAANNNRDNYAILPYVDDLSDKLVSFSLYGSNGNTMEVGVMTNPSDAGTFVPVFSTPFPNYTWTRHEVRLNDTTGGHYLAFHITTTSSYGTSVYLDDVTLMVAPSCEKPQSVSARAITATDATLVIADSNEVLNYHLVMLSGNDTVIDETITDTVLILDTLQHSTLYTVFVSALCDDGTETSVVTTSFRTICEAETMPWIETFDNWTEKSACWSYYSGLYTNGGAPAETSEYAWNLSTSSYGDITIDGKALTMNLYNELKYWAVTPFIEMTSDDAMLTVDVAVAQWNEATPNYDNNDSLILAISTDSGATFNTLRAYGNNELNAFGNTYTTIFVPVSGYNGQAVRFAIYGGSTSGTNPYDNRIAIDNVSVYEFNGCFPITGLTVDAVEANSVTVSWNSDDATSYSLYIDTVYVGSTTDTTYTFTGLTASTGYTLGVLAVCGANDSAARMLNVVAVTDCENGSCDITFVMHDSYGDGWNDAAISVIQNGAEVGQYALPSGSSYANVTASVCSGIPVALRWISGDYDDEASFEVLDGTGQQVFASTDASTLSTSAPFTTIASPCPSCLLVGNLTVDAVDESSISVSWTSSVGDYNVYLNNVFVANVTSNSYTFTGLTASTSYTIGVVALCSDSDSSSMATISARTECEGGGCTITIVGTDSFGDGWDDGYITITQNGNVVGQCTVIGDEYADGDTPATETYIYHVCSNAPVTFTWHVSNYDYEISFVIKNANDSVLYSISDASNLTDGAVFYTATNPCSGAPVVVLDSFYVTLNSANSTMGTASPAGTTAVVDGGSFTATATANQGYRFTGWTNAAGDTVSTANPYTFTVTADIVLTAQFAIGVGIDVADATAVSLFPNPATSSVTVKGIGSNATVAVIDLNGREVLRQQADGTATIDVSTLAKGAYYVRVVNGQATAVRKLIVK
ncbi:MAG: fibronectin type III domain-containing protein [Bacteroidales bacterium]|nr:fibronectin type III domain-containing protein [Bacteroidales bacterium]